MIGGAAVELETVMATSTACEVLGRSRPLTIGDVGRHRTLVWFATGAGPLSLER